MSQQGSIIAIEGNISSGKTTFTGKSVKYLEPLGYKVIVLDDGADIRPISPLLKEFYQHISEQAYPIQIAFSINICQQYREALKWKELGYVVFIICPVGKQVFTELHHNSGNLSDYEYNLLNDMMDIDMELDYIFYIDTSPETCQIRQKHRDREGEIVGLSYLVDISEEYKEQLSKYKNVVYIDWPENAHTNEEVITEYIFSKMDLHRDLTFTTEDSDSEESVYDVIDRRLTRLEMELGGLRERVRINKDKCTFGYCIYKTIDNMLPYLCITMFLIYVAILTSATD